MERKNKKYIAILNVAKTLYWKFGVRRVSVEEICREASVSKMTFYKFFENKQSVAEKVLVNMVESGMVEYHSIMRKDVPFKTKIKELILLKHNSSLDLSNEFLSEIISESDNPLHKLMRDYQEKMMTKIIDDFKLAQKQGAVRKDLNINYMIYMLNSFNNQLNDPNFMKLFANTHDAIMEIINTFFYGILDNLEFEA